MHHDQYVLVNDDSEAARAQLDAVVEAERCRYARMDAERRLPE